MGGRDTDRAESLPRGVLDGQGEKLDAIVRALAAAVYVVDENEVVLTWDAGAERLFGWSASEAVGVPLPLVPASRQAEHDAIRRRTRSGEVSPGLDTERLRKDGSRASVRLCASPLHDATGASSRIVFVALDVGQSCNTEREREVVFLRLVNEASSTLELIREAARFFREELDVEAATVCPEDSESLAYVGAGRAANVILRTADSPGTRQVTGTADSCSGAALECRCAAISMEPAETSTPQPSAASRLSGYPSNELSLRAAGIEDADRERRRGELGATETVRVFPLHAGEECLGLLRVADRRAGRFTPDAVALMERLAEHLAVALARTQSKARLAECASRYEELVAGLEDLVFSLDARGIITYVSPAIERIYGFAPADVMGKHFSELVHPEDLADLAASFERTLAGTVEPHAFRGVNKRGVVRHLRSLSRVCSRNGRVTGVNGVLVDITDLRRAEAAGRDSEQRYRALFEHSSVGLAHCRLDSADASTTDLVVLEANAAFERATGLKGVRGRRLSELVPGIREADPELLALCARAAEGEPTERSEVHVKSLGQWFDISMYSPERHHIVASVDVITERKRTEERLISASHRLERLARFTQALSQARTIESLGEILSQAARALVGADGASFALRDGDFCQFVDKDAAAPLGKGLRLPLADSLTGSAILRREPIVVPNAADASNLAQRADGCPWVASLVILPVRSLEPEGAIVAYWSSSHVTTREEVRVLQALADSASIAMANVRALAELEAEKARTRAIYDHLPGPTFVWKWQGESFTLVDFNKAADTVTRGGAGSLLGKRPDQLPGAIPDLESDLASCLRDHSGVRRELECAIPGAAARRRLVLTYGYIPADMVILHAEDVTDQRQIEERLRLSQRLEAVGRLAGGVAHDFNNLLSVIISYSGFAIDALGDRDPVRADAIEIQAAARRAATLTQQLLAFSRKQVLEPEVLDLNQVIAGMAGMLRRLLGEDIEIATGLSVGLGSVKADLGQLEQVIMNLAVNARDAMPHGGTLAIETKNVELDAAYAARHVAVKPGPYVMLSVSDTGAGMDASTREHLFEPFFTTKEKGKGTGLGLATVYGIAKQSGGNIWAYSEPAQGTTFKVYLPRVDAPARELRRRKPPATTSGTETVLVVEDEEDVRGITERILRAAGYSVLSAPGGGAALSLCAGYAGKVDLLLTDVIMPQMSGPDLATALIARLPQLKVLYMSGYTDTMIVRHGALAPGTNFLSKPFSAGDLTRRVREVLDNAQAIGRRTAQ